ncbi:MAG: energy-coupling factor transporter transmembrane component T [Thermoleophilia bacterium]
MKAPIPPLLCALALIVISLATAQPLIVAAALLGALALHHAAPPPHRLMLRIALISGLFIAVLNPFVAVEGDHVLFAGPSFWLIDFEITSEEVLYGLVAGARLAAAILSTSAFLRLADPDRTQALASRVAPRSALTVALSARLAPTLRRDASGLRETLRLRGTGPERGRRAAIRQGTRLIEPLVASSLERGIDISEAMVARGYGAGRLTRLPEARLQRDEQVALICGVIGLVVAVVLLAGVAPYDIYPLADPIATRVAIVVAALTLATSIVAAGALRTRP